MNTNSQPAGWYNAAGDPQGTVRYWDGAQWQGGPQPSDAPRPYDNTATTPGTLKSRLSDPWLRLGARFLDGLILFIPALVVAVPLALLIPTLGYIEALGFGISLLALGYEYFFLEKENATPGKKIVGIKVIRETGEENLTSEIVVQRLLLHAGLAFIGFVGFFSGLLSLLGFFITIGYYIAVTVMIFTDDLHQVPDDKIAKTVVVKT